MVNRLYPTIGEREFGENPKQYPLLYAGFASDRQNSRKLHTTGRKDREGSIGKVRKPAIRNIRYLGIKIR